MHNHRGQPVRDAVRPVFFAPFPDGSDGLMKVDNGLIEYARGEDAEQECFEDQL